MTCLQPAARTLAAHKLTLLAAAVPWVRRSVGAFGPVSSWSYALARGVFGSRPRLLMSASNDDRPLKVVKAGMRKDMATRLKALDDVYVTQQGALIADRLLGLEQVQKCTGVSVYLSMPNKEVPTYPILDRLFAAVPVKSVFVPKVTGPRSEDMVMLPVTSSQEIEDYPRSKWGIPEPPLGDDKPDATSSGKIDVVIMPGVAFDRRCNRLGHGKGYYDCFLERLTKSNAALGKPPPYTVALALDEQLVEAIPMDSFDRSLDAIVTPTELLLAPR